MVLERGEKSVAGAVEGISVSWWRVAERGDKEGAAEHSRVF